MAGPADPQPAAVNMGEATDIAPALRPRTLPRPGEQPGGENIEPVVAVTPRGAAASGRLKPRA